MKLSKLKKANDEHPYCEPDDECKLKYAEGGLI
jgi:hypothetical protein